MWAGVDNAWEQEKLEASLSWRTVQGKMLENRAESHTSGARFVRRGFVIRFMQLFYITQPNVSYAVWEQTCWSFYDIRHTLLLPMPLGSFLRHALDSK